MSAYYNEIDPYAAQWLRNLIAAGHITAGDVDERSIVDVHADDLRGYRQCHFFAGIAGWSYALRLAGWPDDGPVWTGSCPCQPFSVAGAKRGSADERHLWPAWFRLIRERQPPTIFGEQVSSMDGLGWFDAVSADLEATSYAVAAADLCAAGVGAPHIRQRLYFVAHAESSRRPEGRRYIEERPGFSDDSKVSDAWFPWCAHQWVDCRDGKARPVEPGTFPLADGIPGRVGRLRAYGNAIVPALAAEFVKAFMECQPL